MTRTRATRHYVSGLLAACALSTTVGSGVRAQDSPEHANAPITLKETGDVRALIVKLFDAQGVQYVLTPGVKSEPLKVSLTGVPFRIALETILLASRMPLTYRVQNGIYFIVPKEDEPVTVEPSRTFQIALVNRDAEAVVAQLRDFPDLAKSKATLRALPANNTIVATLADPEFFLNLRQDVQMLDVKPVPIAVKAELVYKVEGSGKQIANGSIVSLGHTTSDHGLLLCAQTEGGSLKTSVIELQSGQMNVRMQPHVNSVGLVNYVATGSLDLTFRLPGTSEPLHVHREFDGADSTASGNTVVLVSSVVKRGSGSNGLTTEITLFLTPTAQQEATPPSVSAATTAASSDVKP